METSLFCCPLCGGTLSRQDRSLICPKGHCFDLSKEGYTNLLPVGQKHAKFPGDDPGMVAARSQFLAAGYYLPLRRALEQAALEFCQTRHQPVLVDCGCGEGYYTAGLYHCLEEAGLNPLVAGFDISKFAVRRAAKQLPQGEFAVASVHHIPLPDHCADLLVDVFSPLDIGEFRRILKPGGGFFYVVPGPKHLWELKEILYQTPYENVEKKVEYPGFCYQKILPVDYTMHLKTSQAIQALFQMTPYYWKTPRAGKEALAQVESLTCRVSFDIHCFTAE